MAMVPLATLAMRTISQIDLYITVVVISFLTYTLDRFIHYVKTYRQHFATLKAHSCQPPSRYPHRDPILGLDLSLRFYRALVNHKYLETEQSVFQENGNTYASSSMGRAALNTCDPENIKTLLSTKFSDYVYGSPRSRRLRFRRLMGQGLMTSDGAAWKHSRGMLQPSFARGHERNLEIFDKYWGRLLEGLPTNTASTVDLQPLFFRFTMETSLDLFVGSSRPPSFDGDVISKFTAAFDRGLRNVTVDFGLGPFTKYTSHSPLQVRKDRKFLESFIDHYVHDALARKAASPLGGETSSVSSSPFLDELLQRTSDPIEIRAELMFVMVAARDTTACLLSNLWFVLAQRPDIFVKLRQEITSIFPLGEKLDLASLEQLSFLKCCINESLRLHPPIPANSKISIRNTLLPVGGGPDGKSPLLVPAGTPVGYSVYTLHRRKDLWGEDAEEFRPERWAERKQPGWKFLPFNGGPRTCLGQKFAMQEASYVTAMLAQTMARIDSRDAAEPWREQLTLTICSKAGVKVDLTPAPARF